MADFKWNREQNIAIKAKAKNILVSAAAGSGKTAVMVERIVRLILSGVPLEKMLIVTFTNASTAEMKARIRKTLKESIEKTNNPKEKKIFREQLESLSTADISNFHGFAMKIINQFFHKLPELEPGYRVEDDVKIRAISKDVLDELFYDYFNSEDDKHKQFIAFLDDYSNGRNFDDIKKKIIALHGDIRNIPKYDDVIHGIIQEYKGIKNSNDLDKYLRSKNNVANYYETILEKKNAKAKKNQKNQKNKTEQNIDEFQLTLNTIVHAAFMLELVLDFDRRFQIAKTEAGVIDFADIEHFAIKLIEDNNISNFYSKKFDYIFIDEYQDTSAIQEYFISKISRKGSLFMVGDIKQSIYRFRNAEPQIFKGKYDEFISEKDAVSESGGLDFEDHSIKIDLSANYRSKKYILDAVNNLFYSNMDGYNEESELKIGAPNPSNVVNEPEYHFIDVEKNDEHDRDELEAILIAKIINDHVGKEYFVGKYEEDSSTGQKNLVSEKRHLEYSDIVILSRTVSGYGAKLAKKLIDLGIPAYVTKKSSFFEAIEIRIFMCLLQVIENRLSDIPLLALLHSEIYGFTDEDLARIALMNEGYYYLNMKSYLESGDSKELVEKIRCFDEQIEKFRRLASEESLDELLWHLMQETNYYMMAGAMPLGDVRQANLQYLIELALDYEQRGNAGLGGYLDMLTRMKIDENINMQEADVTGEGSNAVKIASIHWSKGLEFPMVILTGYNRSLNKSNNNWSFNKDIGLAFKALIPNKTKPEDTILTELIKNIESKEEDDETKRTLYVALTRAKEFLYVVGARPSKNYKSFNRLVEWNGKKKEYVVDDILGFELEIKEINKYNAERTKEIDENRDCVEKFDATLFEDVKRRLEYVYPYEDVSELKPKYTATEINKWRADDDDFFEFPSRSESGTKPVELKNRSELAMPRFLTGKQALSAARRGSIYHKLLEMCDYQSAVASAMKNDEDTTLSEAVDYKIINEESSISVPSDLPISKNSYLNELVSTLIKKEIINADELTQISLENICQFFESNLAERMAIAEAKGQLYKEKQFIYMTTPKDEIFKSNNLENSYDFDKKLLEENIIVQGIIDAFFIEENENGDKRFVLVDFKTNRIDKTNIDSEILRLKDLYKMQMLTYEKAIKYSNFLTNSEDAPEIEKIIYHIGTNLCIKY